MLGVIYLISCAKGWQRRWRHDGSRILRCAKLRTVLEPGVVGPN